VYVSSNDKSKGALSKDLSFVFCKYDLKDNNNLSFRFGHATTSLFCTFKTVSRYLWCLTSQASKFNFSFCHTSFSNYHLDTTRISGIRKLYKLRFLNLFDRKLCFLNALLMMLASLVEK